MQASNNTGTTQSWSRDDKDGDAEVDTAKQFVNENIWVPIVGAVIVVLLVFGVTYGAFRFRKKRRKRRYNYWSLDSISLPSKMELEYQMDTILQRDSALLSCSFYLRSSKEYKLMDHLTEIGSREKKQWFLLRHKKSKTEKLLSIMPRSADMALSFTKTTCRSLKEICQELQHPYVLPVEEMAFQEDQGHVVVIQPCYKSGSLKDYIYSSRWIENYDDKYNIKSPGLSLYEVKMFGRQILEAMLYLKEKGFPWHGHLHSGNVILQDEVCRLSGYENTLLGYPSKLKPLLRRSAQHDTKILDVQSFGHLMFEMLLGQELGAAAPDANHYRAINNTLVVEFLSYIFTRQGGEYPSLKKLSKHQFFQGVWLSELTLSPPSRSAVPQHLKHVFKLIKKGKQATTPSKLRGNMSRASSYGSINSQTSSVSSLHSHNTSEKSPLLSLSLMPISGSDANQSEASPQAKVHRSKRSPAHASSHAKIRSRSPYDEKEPPVKTKSHKSKKARKSRSIQDFSVEIHDGDQPEELQLGRPMINGERSALMNEIRKGVSLKKADTIAKSAPNVL